jgi:histone acetyltransferase (RNA polymerase elongator complex component)
LESGTSTFGGSLNGRNDAYKKEFLKQLRDKMKDKDSKDFEKLMKEAMNSEKAKEEKPEEGGDGKKK